MDFTPPVGLCPVCSNEKATVYGTFERNGVGIVCGRGHSFDNISDFSEGITRSDRKKLMKKEKEILKQATAIEPESTRVDEEEIVTAVEIPKSSDIALDEINQARLKNLLGDFNDASSLVGLVFTLNQEKRDLEKKIRHSKKIQPEEEDGKMLLSGELEFKGRIPERHVRPMLDLIHSWGKTVPEYMNERLEQLLDDCLFY